MGGVAGFGAAMLGALWAYNGWNEITYVGEEIKDPGRNLPFAIVGGIGIIAALYIFANLAYFYALTPGEVASVPAAGAVATEAVMRALGPRAAGLMAAAMATSVFGALLVASLVSARIPYAMARDGLFFRSLDKISPTSRVPIRALVAQNVWSMLLVLSGSYDTLTDYSIFVILIFVALSTMSVFVFRRRGDAGESDYRMWGYPVVPVLFLVVAVWLIGNTLMATPGRALAGLGLMACGLPFYWYWTRRLTAASVRADA
jgi:APA family basic amino acid/polyamine antiporter